MWDWVIEHTWREQTEETSSRTETEIKNMSGVEVGTCKGLKMGNSPDSPSGLCKFGGEKGGHVCVAGLQGAVG